MFVLPVPFEFFTLSVSKKEIISVGFFLFWELIYRYMPVLSLFPFYILHVYINFKDAYFDSDLYKNSNLTYVYCAFLCYYLNQLIVYRKLLWPWQFIILYIHLPVSPSLQLVQFVFFYFFNMIHGMWMINWSHI